MAFWNNNNREESKPTFLNKIQKRLAVRTPRGWEIPLMGSLFGYGLTNGSSFGSDGITAATVLTEVVVALPNDPSTDGTISSNYAYGPTGMLGIGRSDGYTFGSEQQFRPYFTAPFNADSATSGGPNSVGVTHAFLTYVPSFTNGYPTPWAAGMTPGAGNGVQYGVNAYGVSTLGGLTGVTAYIKIQANDTNLSQSLTIGLSGTYSGISLFTNNTLTAGNVPFDVYNVFFGPTGDKNGRASYRQDNIAVLRVDGATAFGTRTVVLNVNDNSLSVGSHNPYTGVTGATSAVSFTMTFDRVAGLTTAGIAAGASIGDYIWAKNNTIRN